MGSAAAGGILGFAPCLGAGACDAGVGGAGVGGALTGGAGVGGALTGVAGFDISTASVDFTVGN